MIDDRSDEEIIRARAVRQLRKRRDFYRHLVVYVLVNAFLVAIWAITTPGMFFWPAIPIAAWGIGVGINAWDAFHRDEFSQEQIREEMKHLQRTK